MIYLKLSVRNARRSFTDYLLYIAAMTILLAVAEVSSCIAVAGKSAGFQTFSLPLLIAVILIVLMGYMDNFMLMQRARELASYLLLGMDKKILIRLFLCEVLLIGFFCCLAGTGAGLALYGLRYFRPPLQDAPHGGLPWGQSMLSTFLLFCLVETVCSFRLKRRLNRLQIRELMQEKKSCQGAAGAGNHKRWGILFLSCFACLTACVWGIVYLPGAYAVYPVSVTAVPLFLSVLSFYGWASGWLSWHRRRKSAWLFHKDRLCLVANMTRGSRRAVPVTAVFCVCLLFSGFSFLTGALMLQPEFPLSDPTARQWMGTSQIGICVVFLVIYFSLLSLHRIIEIRQDAGSCHLMRCLGKSGRQVRKLLDRQTALQLATPMTMALLVFLCYIPPLNGKMNRILPDAMHNILLHLAGEFWGMILLFCACYLGIVHVMGRRYLNAPA